MFKKREHAAPLIKMMSEAIERKANGILQKYHVTSCQVHLLAALCAMENGECTLKELEKEFSFSSAAIAGVVTRLEAKNFITGSAHPTDKRIKCIRITDDGRKIAEASEKELTKLEGYLLQDFSEKEKQVWLAQLMKVYERSIEL